jgi:hypothetical protein
MDDRPEADSQRCHQSELPIDGHENCPRVPLPQPGQRRWSSGLGGRAIEALRMDDGLSIGAVRPVETTNGLLIGQRRREAVTAVLRLTRT